MALLPKMNATFWICAVPPTSVTVLLAGAVSVTADGGVERLVRFIVPTAGVFNMICTMSHDCAGTVFATHVAVTVTTFDGITNDALVGCV